jgi:hypothetical protein
MNGKAPNKNHRRVAHAKFLEPTVEVRGNPPFAKKKRRMGHLASLKTRNAWLIG